MLILKCHVCYGEYREFEMQAEHGQAAEDEWNRVLAKYREKYRHEGAEFMQLLNKSLPDDWERVLPVKFSSPFPYLFVCLLFKSLKDSFFPNSLLSSGIVKSFHLFTSLLISLHLSTFGNPYDCSTFSFTSLIDCSTFK